MPELNFLIVARLCTMALMGSACVVWVVKIVTGMYVRVPVPPWAFILCILSFLSFFATLLITVELPELSASLRLITAAVFLWATLLLKGKD